MGIHRISHPITLYKPSGAWKESLDRMLDLTLCQLLQFAIEHGPFIVSLPIKNGDFP